MERKNITLIAGAVVALVVVLLLFLFLSGEKAAVVSIEEDYSFSFNEASFSKHVSIKPSNHIEAFSLSNADNFALITIVPKSIASSASRIKSAGSTASLTVLDEDPILKFVRSGTEPFWIKLEFPNTDKDICSINILLPRSYIDSISVSELEELKIEWRGYSALDLSCAEAHETEVALAKDLQNVFASTDFKDTEQESVIYLQGEADTTSQIIGVLQNNKNSGSDAGVATGALDSVHSGVLSVLLNMRQHLEQSKAALDQVSDGTESPATVEVPDAIEGDQLQIYFTDSPEKVKAMNLRSLRLSYPLLAKKEPINLTISDSIPESYYSTYLVYPEPSYIGGTEVLEFKVPLVSFEGIDPNLFNVSITEVEPSLHKLELTFRTTNANVVNESGVADGSFGIFVDEVVGREEGGAIVKVYIKVPKPLKQRIGGGAFEISLESKLPDGSFRSSGLMQSYIGDLEWVEGKGYEFEFELKPELSLGGNYRFAVETIPDGHSTIAKEDGSYDRRNAKEFLLEDLGFREVGLSEAETAFSGEFSTGSFFSPFGNSQKASGNIIFTYGDTIPPAIIKLPLNIWQDPCKPIKEDIRENTQLFTDLLTCYQSQIGKAKLEYAKRRIDVQESAARGIKRFEEEKEAGLAKKVIFMTAPAFSQALENFGADFSYSTLRSSVGSNVILVQDELELSELPQLSWYAKNIKESRSNTRDVTVAYSDFIRIFDNILPEVQKLSDTEGISDTGSNVGVGGGSFNKNFIRITPEKALYNNGEKVRLQFYVDNFEPELFSQSEYYNDFECALGLQMKRVKGAVQDTVMGGIGVDPFDFTSVPGYFFAMGENLLVNNEYYVVDTTIAANLGEGAKWAYDETNEYRYYLECKDGTAYTNTFKIESLSMQEFSLAIENGKIVAEKSKIVWLAEARFEQDPFNQDNRGAFVAASLQLEEAVTGAPPETEEELRDFLDQKYGSQEELIKRLEDEISALDKRWQSLDKAQPKWYGYFNPLVLISTGLESIKDIVFDSKIELSREEFKKKIGREKRVLELQKSTIQDIISRLRKGQSLQEIYSEPRNFILEINDGKPFQESYKSMYTSQPTVDPYEAVETSFGGATIFGDGYDSMWVTGDSSVYLNTEAKQKAHRKEFDSLIALGAFFHNPVLRGELRKQRLILDKVFIPSMDYAEAFYATVHPLEIERDTLFSIGLLLEAKNKATMEGKKSWREANLVHVVRTFYEAATEKHLERSDLANSLFIEQMGVEKIISMLQEGSQLLEITEPNRVRLGPKFVLKKNIPQVITSDISLTLNDWHHDSQRWEIEASFKGIGGDSAWPLLHQQAGFHNVPGLIIEPIKWVGDDVEVGVYVDEGVLERFISEASREMVPEDSSVQIGPELTIGENDVYETALPGVLLAADPIFFSEIGTEKSNKNRVVVEATAQIMLFESSAMSAEEASRILGSSEFWGFNKLKEELEKRGAKTDYFSAKIVYSFDKENFSGLERVSRITHMGINRINTFEYTAVDNEGFFSSSTFPGLMINIIDFKATQSTRHRDIGRKILREGQLSYQTYYENLPSKYSDAMASEQLREDKHGSTFDTYLVVEPTGKLDSLQVSWLEHPNGKSEELQVSYYRVFREPIDDTQELPEQLGTTSFEDTGLISGQEYGYYVAAFNADGEQIVRTPTVLEISAEDIALDYQISAALSNPVVDMLVQQHKILLDGNEISEEDSAEMAFKVAQRQERLALWQPAFDSYKSIYKLHPATVYGQLSMEKATSMGEKIGNEEFVAFLEGLTSVDSVIDYLLIVGVVKVISRTVQLTKAARMTQIAKTDSIVNASVMLGRPTHYLPTAAQSAKAASKWTRLKAYVGSPNRFWNYPLEDLIARPLSKPFIAVQNWRVGNAFTTVRVAEPGIMRVLWQPGVDDIAAALPQHAQRAGAIRFWNTGKGIIYQGPGGGFIGVTNNAELLSQAVTNARRFSKASQYLAKRGVLPAEFAKKAEVVQALFDHAAVNITPVAGATGSTALVPVIQSETQAISILRQSLVPLKGTAVTQLSVASPVVVAFDSLVGRSGALAETLTNNIGFGADIPVIGRSFPELTKFVASSSELIPVPIYVSDTLEMVGDIAYSADLDAIIFPAGDLLRGRFVSKSGLSGESYLRPIAAHEINHSKFAHLSREAQQEVVNAVESSMGVEQLVKMAENQPAIGGRKWPKEQFEFDPVLFEGTSEIEQAAIRADLAKYNEGLGLKNLNIRQLSDGRYINFDRFVTEFVAINGELVVNGKISQGMIDDFFAPGKPMHAVQKYGFLDVKRGVDAFVDFLKANPNYAPLFTPEKIISPGTNGTVLPGECSCVVNVPMESDETIVFFRSHPNLDQLVKTEQVGESLRTTINVSAGDDVTEIVFGEKTSSFTFSGATDFQEMLIQLGATGDVTSVVEKSLFSDNFELYGFDSSAVDQIVFKKVAELSDGSGGVIKLRLIIDGSQRIMLVEATPSVKTVAFIRETRTEIVAAGKRSQLSGTLSQHRRKFFVLGTDRGGYVLTRNFDSLMQKGFDIKSYIETSFPEQSQIAVLDSGAGWLGMTGDLKTHFGDRVFVTSVGINYPKLPPELEADLADFISVESTPDVRVLMQEQLDTMRRAGRLADDFSSNPAAGEIRVSTIEGLQTDRTYDLIIDISGPMTHSNLNQVIVKYLDFLSPNGKALIQTGVTQGNKLLRRAPTKGNANFTFEVRQLQPGFYELTKVPVTMP